MYLNIYFITIEDIVYKYQWFVFFHPDDDFEYAFEYWKYDELCKDNRGN